MDSFTTKLAEFTEKTVCYGTGGDVRALIEYAESAGLKKVAELLCRYRSAEEEGDSLKAAKYFAALHMFLYAAEG